MSKALVAYFSRTGEQYSVGNITEGNTAIIAKIIAEKVNADIYEIKVVEDNYPNEYAPLVKFAQLEKFVNSRPELVGRVNNMSEYDTIFLGYPNWFAALPMPVNTFLESYNFAGKTIHHFCTHEGSGGVVQNGFQIYGHIPQKDRPEAEKQVQEWLDSLGY